MGPVSTACEDVAPLAPMGDPWFFAPAFDCAEDSTIPCDDARVPSMGGNVHRWCNWQSTDAAIGVPASDVVLWHTHAPTMIVGITKCTRVEYGGRCAVYRGKDNLADVEVVIETWYAPTSQPGWVEIRTTTKEGGTFDGVCTISCP